MSIAPVWLLFVPAVLTALLGLFRKSAAPLACLLSALCTLAGVLAGLVLGCSLEDLIPPLLAVCAASMAAMPRNRGEGDS